MLSARSSDLHQKTLLMKQDDKFFSRLLTRELSMNRSRSAKNGSFRGLPSSVPFTWESQPGTPRHRFSSGAEPLPPLTPPPSYYSAHNPINRHTSCRPNNPIHILFLKLNIITWPSNHVHAAQPSSPSLSSYSSSISSATRRRLGSWGGSSSSSSTSSKVDEDDSDGIVGSPTSTPCFMIRRQRWSKRGCNSQKESMSVGSN